MVFCVVCLTELTFSTENATWVKDALKVKLFKPKLQETTTFSDIKQSTKCPKIALEFSFNAYKVLTVLAEAARGVLALPAPRQHGRDQGGPRAPRHGLRRREPARGRAR